MIKCEDCKWWEVSCTATEAAYEYQHCRKKCETCFDSFRGVCRRYPPQIEPLEADDENSLVGKWFEWPVTENIDWCGEFKAK